MPRASSSSSSGTKGLSPFEARLYDVCLNAPGSLLMQEDLSTRFADVEIADRLAAVNGLLRKGLLRVLQTKAGPQYKAVAKTEAKAANALERDEQLLYEHIRESGNEGIWTRTLKVRTGLHQTLITRYLKSLEQKQMIKSVKSVKHPTRKLYMLYNLTPSTELTGGPWYTDNELDTEFISFVSKACLAFIRERSFPKGGSSDALFPTSRTASLPTIAQVRQFIKSSGITDVNLEPEHIEALLDVLVYDGELEKIPIIPRAAVGRADDEEWKEGSRPGWESVDESSSSRSRSGGSSESESESVSDSESSTGTRSKSSSASASVSGSASDSSVSDSASDSGSVSGSVSGSESGSKKRKRSSSKSSKRHRSSKDKRHRLRSHSRSSHSSRHRHRSSSSRRRREKERERRRKERKGSSKRKSSRSSSKPSRSKSKSKDKHKHKERRESSKSKSRRLDRTPSPLPVETMADGTTLESSGMPFVYRAIRPERIPLGWTQAPCGQCPIFDFCATGGPVNPGNCRYYDDWLELNVKVKVPGKSRRGAGVGKGEGAEAEEGANGIGKASVEVELEEPEVEREEDGMDEDLHGEVVVEDAENGWEEADDYAMADQSGEW